MFEWRLLAIFAADPNGPLQAGSRSGVGVYVWPTGARYRGEWKDGFMHGVGTLSAPNGALYQVCGLFLPSRLATCKTGLHLQIKLQM